MTRSTAIGIGAIAVSFVTLVVWAFGDTTRVEVTTAPVTSGPIDRVIVATGTLQAVTTVEVGSQVSGDRDSPINSGQRSSRARAIREICSSRTPSSTIRPG